MQWLLKNIATAAKINRTSNIKSRVCYHCYFFFVKLRFWQGFWCIVNNVECSFQSFRESVVFFFFFSQTCMRLVRHPCGTWWRNAAEDALTTSSRAFLRVEALQGTLNCSPSDLLGRAGPRRASTDYSNNRFLLQHTFVLLIQLPGLFIDIHP